MGKVLTDNPNSSSCYFWDQVFIKNCYSGDNLLKSSGGVFELRLVSNGCSLYDYAMLCLDESFNV